MAEDNGKITWYEAIKEALTDIKDDIREIKEAQKIQASKMNEICISIGTHDTKIQTAQSEIDKLRTNSRNWDAVIALLTVILGALGLTKS